jgi:hypothetical protein
MKLKLKRILSALLGLFYIVWFFIPVTIGENSVMLTPYSMKNIFLYIIPLLGLVKILSLFLGNKMGFLGIPSGIFQSLLRFFETFLMLYTVTIPVLNNAGSVEYLSF